MVMTWSGRGRPRITLGRSSLILTHSLVLGVALTSRSFGGKAASMAALSGWSVIGATGSTPFAALSGAATISGVASPAVGSAAGEGDSIERNVARALAFLERFGFGSAGFSASTGTGASASASGTG